MYIYYYECTYTNTCTYTHIVIHVHIPYLFDKTPSLLLYWTFGPGVKDGRLFEVVS